MDSQQARRQQMFHRDNRELPSEALVLTLNLAALRQMGITDRYEICRILNVGEGDECYYRVRAIDRLFNIYRMLTWGTPQGMFMDLHRPLKCPRCAQEITVIPCVHCTCQGAWPTRMTDTVPDWRE